MPISRWLMIERLFGCRNSIGSSIVEILTSGLPPREYYWRVFSKDNTNLVTYSNQWWSFKLGTVTGIDVEVDITVIPETFQLLQNYPNPFNASTIIRYGIPISGLVDISIYNSVGKRIITLVNAYRSIGWYQVNWSGKDEHGDQVASGSYLYQIKVGKFKKTGKMIYLK